MEKLEDVLIEAKSRAQTLQEIVAASEEVRKREKDVLFNQGFILYADYQDKSMEEERILSSLEQCGEEIERLSLEYQEACDAASRAQDAYYEARTHSQNSDEAQKLNGLREDERNLLHEVSEAQKKLSRFSNASNDLTYALKRSEELGFTPPSELYPAYIQSMPPDRRGTLQVKLEQYVKKTADQLDSAHLDLAIQAKAQTEKREELHRRIEILSSGRLVYPDHNRAQKVKDKADFKLSMGKMTFPHHLARIMVLEQLYRAEAIQAGSKYHK